MSDERRIKPGSRSRALPGSEDLQRQRMGWLFHHRTLPLRLAPLEGRSLLLLSERAAWRRSHTGCLDQKFYTPWGWCLFQNSWLQLPARLLPEKSLLRLQVLL